MIGPSSSHTAGAVRIGLVARAVLGAPPLKADIELHGSFAATGKGHATDRALVAGLLGFLPDDERIKDGLAFGANAGLRVSFSSVDLGEEAHPNTARITMELSDGESCRIIGSSTGGGSIRIVDVDGYPTSFGGELETALLWHRDGPGFLAKVTALLACAEANIATIRTSRHGRGAEALTVIELDSPLPGDCLSLLGRLPSTFKARHLHRLP